jgi:hypothetical protein
VGESVVAFVWKLVVNIIVSAVVGKILAPSLPKDARENRGIKSTIRSNVAPRRVAYGESVTGGPYILLETRGADSEFLHFIVAVAGHPIEDVLGVFIDDYYVNISGPGGTTNNSTSINMLDSDYYVDEGRYGTGDANGAVRIIKNLGWGYADYNYVTDGTASKAVDDRSRGNLIDNALNTWDTPGSTRDSGTGLYNEGDKLTNIPHIYVALEYRENIWAGIPQIRFHIKGKPLYNPALDSSLVDEGADSAGTHDLSDPDTWEYSEDWTLCVLDYLINTDYGLGAYTSGNIVEIDWVEAIQSYTDSSFNITNGLPSPYTDNVPRYTINGIFEVDATPISIMEMLLTSGAGELIYSQGTYKIRPGVYREPNSSSDIINEDMMTSPLLIRTHTPRSELFNKAAGVFVDASYDRSAPITNANMPLFESSDFPIVNPLDSSGLNPYEVIDGEEIIRDLDYPMTISVAEAQRLARIQLERVRRGFIVSFKATLEVLKYSVGDTVYLEILNNSKYGNEVFFNRLGLDDSVQDRPDSPQTPYYKQFKIVEMQYIDDFNIEVAMMEEYDSIYDWNEGDASPAENKLISDLIIDEPVGIVQPASWVVDSPNQAVTEIVVGTNIRTELRWTAPDRGSIVNQIDRAHIHSYRIEYGIVTDPSLTPTNRVAEWVSGGTYIVEDRTLLIQGPIWLTNIYIDETTVYDFRVKSTTYNGRSSAWAYYSTDIGSDYQPTIPIVDDSGQPGTVFVIEYDDLDDTESPQLAGENSRYAMLSSRSDVTSGLIQNFHQTDAILLNKADVNSIPRDHYYQDLEVGDRVLFNISTSRWWRFEIDTLPTTVGSGSSLAYLIPVTLIDYRESDPSATRSTSSGNSVLFEFSKPIDKIDNLLLDPDFDLSTGLGAANGFWDYGTNDGSGWSEQASVTFLTSGGADGSNAIELKTGDGAAGSAELYPIRTIRSNNTSFEFRIRYKTTTQNSPDWVPRIHCAARGYKDINIRGSADDLGTETIQTESYNTWDNIRATVSPFTGTGDSRFWDFEVSITNQPLLPGFAHTVVIDSIFIYPVPDEFGDTAGSSTYVSAGLVPQANSTVDAGKFLRVDGTWQTVAGGVTELNDLSDVILDSVNGANLDFLQKDSANWVNVTRDEANVGYNTMPIYEIDANDTFDLANMSKLWHKDSGGSVSFTCADDSNIPQGGTWVVHNEDTENITITTNSPVILYWLEAGATPVSGDITVEQGGIITVYKYADQEYWAWGSKETAGTGVSIGTVDNAILRWADSPINGWVEEDRIQVSSAGVLSILNSGLTDSMQFSHDGTDANIDFVLTDQCNLNDVSLRLVQGSLYLDEKASAGSDITGVMQLWSLNTTPNEFWMTDDAGTNLPVGLNTMPVYEIDANDTFDNTNKSKIWHKDSGGAVSYICADDSSIPLGSLWMTANEDAEDITITTNSPVVLRWFHGQSGGTTTGDRTLAQAGIASIYKYAAQEYWIWGTGLT